MIGYASIAYSQNECGPNFLYCISRLWDKLYTLEEVYKQTHFNKKHGITLYDIYKAAKMLGINFKGVKGKRIIKNAEGIYIIYTKNHFSVIYNDLSMKRIYIQNPPNIPQIISQSDLFSIWGGVCLLYPTKNNEINI